MKFSFHNHSVYSDGTSSIREMLDEAVKGGFDYFAMTDHIHSDLGADWTMSFEKYDEYLRDLARYKKEYEDRLVILTGIEADWYIGKGTYFGRYEMLEDALDITVGSVHNIFADGVCYVIDDTKEEFRACLNEGFGGNIRDMVACYYEIYGDMAENFTKADFLGHIDLIRKNNADGEFYDENEKWVKDLQKALAKKMGRFERVTEINGGGAYRRNNDVYYPSMQFIEYLKEEGVRFTMGLDAHNTDMVNSYYDRSIEYMKNAGIEKLWYFDSGEWKEDK